MGMVVCEFKKGFGWARTAHSLDSVKFGIVPHIRCLGFVDLHQTVLADLGRSEVFLVPCKTSEDRDEWVVYRAQQEQR